MNKRIRTPIFIFFLNVDYFAARSLPSLRSNYQPLTLCFWHFELFCPTVALISKEQSFAFVMRANIKLRVLFDESSCKMLDLNL